MSRVKKEEVFVILIHFPKSGCKKLSALTEYELKVTKDILDRASGFTYLLFYKSISIRYLIKGNSLASLKL